MRGGHSVTWSDREVGIMAPPVPHILVGHDASAVSRLDRYFDDRQAPPPRPAKPQNIIGHPKLNVPKMSTLQHPQQPPILRQLQMNPPLIDGAACKTSTWTYKHVSSRNTGVSVIEKGARFRPERRERRPLQRLQWKDSAWPRGFAASKDDYLDLDTRLPTSSSEMSQQNVIKKILVLTENLQYRDAASLIQRLPTATFKLILNDLPIDVLVEGMPQTLPLIESLYCKLAETAPPSLGSSMPLRPENVVWQMVRFFAQQEECLTGDIRWEFCGPFVTSCKKILRVIARSEPKIRKTLHRRRKRLEKSIEGMGHHGLVGTSDESLQSLHDALKLEFEKVVKSYTQALEKLLELSLSNKQSLQRSISHGPAPVQASHQRQLSITPEEVQQRLIKNKTLLNVVEPTLNNHSLDILLGIMQRRIEYDKEALFQFTQLRKEAKEIDTNAVMAPILMRYSHGCEQVTEMIKETMEEDGTLTTPDDDAESSDVSGYHSDSDSAIMMSGNSPFISKHARFNFLTRSVRDRSKVGLRASLPFAISSSTTSGVSCSGSSDTQSQGSGGNDSKSDSLTPEGIRKGPQTPGSGVDQSRNAGRSSADVPKSAGERETTALRQEVETLRAEITKARQTILHMQERENKRKECSSRSDLRMAKYHGSSRIENLNLVERRPSSLVKRYAQLYAQTRLDTFDSLDALPDLRKADELKAKLLFSVIVLSFRSASATASFLREDIRRTLQMAPNETEGSHTRAVELAISSFIANNVDNYDLTKNVDEVCEQIWATLYDYPCLKTSEAILKYTKACVRIAWGLVNQSPPFALEYEHRTFRKDLHVRFHSADPTSDNIKTYIWPALLEGPGGPCVHQGVVMT